VTEDRRDALFDDELDGLTSSTRLLLGEHAVIAAVDRAVATLGLKGVTSVEDVPRLPHAIKADLRRLITPH
jgi:hypothetical protein